MNSRTPKLPWFCTLQLDVATNSCPPSSLTAHLPFILHLHGQKAAMSLIHQDHLSYPRCPSVQTKRSRPHRSGRLDTRTAMFGFAKEADSVLTRYCSCANVEGIVGVEVGSTSLSVYGWKLMCFMIFSAVCATRNTRLREWTCAIMCTVTSQQRSKHFSNEMAALAWIWVRDCTSVETAQE